ncbi:MAG: hypothetical protein AAGD40_08775 [Pseudomonadota bacterium]
MIGKVIGAALGRKAANAIGTKVGGPIGAAIGYGLVSRRFRGVALGGLAVMGGLAVLKRLRGEDDAPRVDMRDGNEASATADRLTAYAPRA